MSIPPHLPALPSYPLPFYTTTTTTVLHTTTASIGAVLHLTIPTPATPVPTSYTTPPSPASPDGKAYPNGLPILVLTELDVVVYDASRNEALTTLTTVQSAPGATDDAVKPDGDAYLKNDWGDWTRAERAGVIAGIVVAVMLTMGMLLWCCCRRRAWGRRGERNRRRRRGGARRSGKDSWGSRIRMGLRGGIAEDVGSKQIEVEMETDPEGGVEGDKSGDLDPRGREGLPDSSVSRETVRSLPEVPVGVASDRDRELGGEHHQMSGALSLPWSPAPTHQRSPVLGVYSGAQGVHGTQFSTVASAGRVSAYRAMREQEKEDERARAYPQMPSSAV
ncbi:MAG: hypothetical protein Q9186_004515 [Xanthomendoza sp. 1 TL-2023]